MGEAGLPSRLRADAGFWDASLRVVVLGGFVREVREGQECPVSVPCGGWQRAETVTLNRGLIRPGVAETPLFNNVRTVKVRGGHLGPDGTLVKLLQQVPMIGHLVVPLATLDSEL
jgi:hypothetical protein